MISFAFEPPFGVQTIKEILPHRYPFLLVDRITEFGQDSVKGYKNLTGNEEIFQGHFPGEPVYPGVLVIETVAQVGACWILSHEEHVGKTAYLMSVESAKFRKPVVPGDRLEVHGKITNLKSRTGRLEAQVFVGEQRVADVAVLFAFQSNKVS